jgi:hypothetical protein
MCRSDGRIERIAEQIVEEEGFEPFGRQHVDRVKEYRKADILEALVDREKSLVR